MIKQRLLAVLALFGLTAAVAVWFVAQERLLYYSDIRFYHQLTLESWRQLQTGLQPWLEFLRHWFGQDYNALFTLPLLPGIAVGGDSRPVYIALLALCYLAPAALVAGLLGRMFYPSARSQAFWLSTILMLSSAALWQPVLRGYPDVGGVALVGLALWLYLRDSELRRWRTILGLAVLSGLTILFRRHFGYAVVALYGALGTTQGLLLWRQTPSWGAFIRGLLRFGLRLMLMLLGAVLLMAWLAPEFTWRALAVDYSELYRSFQQTPSETGWFLVQGFGLILPGLALLGIGLAWRCSCLRGEHALLLFLLAAFWIFIFIFLVRQPGHHYRIHWLPLLCGLGLAFLVLELRRSSRLAALAVLGLALSVAAYAVIGYNTGLRALVGEPNRLFWPEPVEAWRYHEKDYDTYLRLAEVLHRESAQGEYLYVATSSPLIGDDILLAAEEMIATERRLKPLPVAAVDSRDFYPVVTLVGADLVLIPQPALLTVPAQQRVLQSSVDIFTQHWPFSEDFKLLPEKFRLSDGTVLHLYRRLRPSSLPVIIETLARLQTELHGLELGTQSDWISASQQGVSIIYNLEQALVIIRLSLVAEKTPPVIIHTYPVLGKVILNGELKALGCAQAHLSIDLYTSEGQHLQALPRQALVPQQPVSLLIKAGQKSYLALALQSDEPGCFAEFAGLSVQPA